MSWLALLAEPSTAPRPPPSHTSLPLRDRRVFSCTCAGIRWSQQYSYCSYQPDPKLQEPYDPRTEFRSYDCIYPLWQVRNTCFTLRPGVWGGGGIMMVMMLGEGQQSLQCHHTFVCVKRLNGVTTLSSATTVSTPCGR